MPYVFVQPYKMEAARCLLFLTSSLWVIGLTSGQYRDIEQCYDNSSLCFITNTNRDVSLKTWQSADEFCRNRSATLPIITSTHLQNRLGEFLTAFDLTIDSVWLGARGQTYSDSAYHWLDGTQLASGLLNDGVTPESLPTLTAFNGSTLLHTAYIHQELTYICQFKGYESAAACTGGSDRFVYGGVCYVVYPERLNWFMARNRCLQREGDLAQLSTKLLQTIKGSINIPESTYPNTPNGLWLALRKFWWIWKSGSEESEVTQSYFQTWLTVSNPSDYCITTSYRQLWAWTLSNCSQRYFVVCQRSAPTPIVTSADPSTQTVSLPVWAVGLICGLVGAFYIASLVVVGCIIYRKCSKKESLYPQMPPPDRLDRHNDCDAGDEYEVPQTTNAYTQSPYEV